VFWRPPEWQGSYVVGRTPKSPYSSVTRSARRSPVLTMIRDLSPDAGAGEGTPKDGGDALAGPGASHLMVLAASDGQSMRSSSWIAVVLRVGSEMMRLKTSKEEEDADDSKARFLTFGLAIFTMEWWVAYYASDVASKLI
jgi:hypothetical protein